MTSTAAGPSSPNTPSDAPPAMPSEAPSLPEPVVEGGWLRPAPGERAEPRWGHPEGLQVGIHPTPGPRGLLRLFTPYLDHPRERLINFVAVEPIPSGADRRGFSELEHSDLDDLPGKRFWSADDAADSTPLAPERPARGVVETADGVTRLTVFVGVEPFANGAHVYLRVRFRADRPHEVSLAAFRRDDSAALDHCVLTATMGNFARLRRLHLADRVVHAEDLWPGFTGDHFTDRAGFPLADLARTPEGLVEVAATPDEATPTRAGYAAGTADHWRYVGRTAVQTWRADDPDPALQVLVNGRRAYWASTSAIPGGTSYENFELFEPFRQGRELHFAIEELDQSGDASWSA